MLAIPPPCHDTSKPMSTKVMNAGAAHTHGRQAPRGAADAWVALPDSGCRSAAMSERHCVSAQLNHHLTHTTATQLHGTPHVQRQESA